MDFVKTIAFLVPILSDLGLTHFALYPYAFTCEYADRLLHFDAVDDLHSILCVLAIIFSIIMTAGLAHIKSNGSETADSGAAGAFDNIRDVIGPLNNELKDLVNDSLVTIRSTGFVPVDTLITELDTIVVQGHTLVASISTILDTTDVAFANLSSVFRQLAEIATEYNQNVTVPSSSDVPSVSADTKPLLNSANASMNDFGYQIGNLSVKIDDVKNQINDSSPTVQDIYSKINDTVGKVMTNIDSYQSDYNSYEIPKKIDDYYAYVILSNKIRLPVMIVLLAIPIILFGLWFIGSCTDAYKLMLVGFWWAAAICWLMMILAAVHIILFVPLNQMCNNKEELISKGLTDFVFTNGTNYASSLGIDSPQSAVDALNSAVSLVLSNPSLVLNCKDDESIVTLLGIDVPAIIDIDGQFESAKQDIEDKANSIDINTTISDAQPVFRSVMSGIDSIQSNLTEYSGELANFSNTFNSFAANFNYTSLWNATAQSNAETQLNAINTYVAGHIPPYTAVTYTFDTIGDFNPNTATTNGDRQTLSARKIVVVDLVKANKTAQNVTALLAEWNDSMATLNTQLSSVSTLVTYGKSVINGGWALVNASIDIPTQVVNACNAVLDDAVASANTLAEVPELGKCAFVGNFVRKGVSQGACREARSSAGGVALCIFFLAIVWLVSWPLILSSKYHFTGSHGSGKSKDDKFFEQEMKAARRNENA